MFDHPEIYSATGLMDLISQVGFLPLLNSGIDGFCAEEVVTPDCRYVTFDDGGWDWPMWKWKGPILRDMGCYYGKFFDKKAGYIDRAWWPDFCNYRRSQYPTPAEGSIEETILMTLRECGSLVTRDLRAACGFEGKGMRSKFDSFVTRLEMGCYIVTEDFVYRKDKQGRDYGWGLSLLTTPEQLHGIEAQQTDHTPEESHRLLLEHFQRILPDATKQQIQKIIG